MTLEKYHERIGVAIFMNKDETIMDISLKSVKGKMIFGKSIALKRSSRARLAGSDDDLTGACVIRGCKGVSRIITATDSTLNRL